MRLAASSRGRIGVPGAPRYENPYLLRQINDYLLNLPPIGDTSGLTLVSGDLDAAVVDGAGKVFSASSAGQRMAYDTSNGYPEVVAVNADGSDLKSATGGVAGAGGHACWYYGSRGSNGAAGNYLGGLGFGPRVGNTQNSALGTEGAGLTWGGGSGYTLPRLADDSGRHLFWMDFDGANSTVRIDGSSSAGALPSVTTGITATALKSITTAEVGIRPVFSAAVPDMRLDGAGWVKRLPTMAERRRVERYWRRRAAVTSPARIVGIGDSQTAGIGSSAGNTWHDQMPALNSPFVYISAAVTNRTTADTLSTYALEVLNRASGMYPNSAAVVWCATNNFFAGGSAAAAWADNQTIGAALAATDHWKAILVLALPRQEAGTPPGYEAARIAFRDLALAGYAATGYIGILDPAPLLPDPTDLTYYQADKLHLNPAGELVIANALGPLLNRVL